MNMQVAAGLLYFALFSAAGWGILFTGIRGRAEADRREERERARASGRIVALVPKVHRYGRHRGNRVTYWYPEVAFTAEGREYRLESKDGFHEGEVSLGDAADILYDPDDPTRFHLERFGEKDRLGCRRMTIAGGVWIAVAAAIAVACGVWIEI